MGKIADLDLDGTATSGYSDPLALPGKFRVSFHLDQTEDTATYLVNVTLQVSNKKNPDLDTDTDWVDFDADPFGGQPSGTTKDYAQDALDSAWCRLKFERQTGAGNTKVFALVKSRGN